MGKVFCKCGCGIKIEPIDKKGRRRLYVSGHNTAHRYPYGFIPKKGIMENQGYLYFTNEYKKIYIHKYMMEIYLGHPIPKGIIVHHKNGNKHDNRIENFEMLTWAEHARIHYKERKLNNKKQFI